MRIKILSESTINKIAAGEVIERPASVIKELVENSIDAKATKVSIVLESAGKNLISIRDNGVGMDKEELELAVQRHATSKLDEDDLLNINSFGFRGEALPSIGAISRFTITSRKIDNPVAYCIKLIGGVLEPVKVSSLNHGTLSEVRDLFFATPARLKFLRSDKTELAACVAVVKKIALAHPDVFFTLTHDGKDLLNLEAVDKLDIASRIGQLLGHDFVDNSAIVELIRDGVRIYGYSSIPTYSKAAAEDQFLFINKRPVKDKLLNVALKVAYQDYLARDRHPVSVLFIDIDPQQIDVNVHPAKSEVRFHDPNMIRNIVISAIKTGLQSVSHKVSTTHAQSMLNRFMAPNIQQELKQESNTSSESAFRENLDEPPNASKLDPFIMARASFSSSGSFSHNNSRSNSTASSGVFSSKYPDKLIDAKPFARIYDDPTPRVEPEALPTQSTDENSAQNNTGYNNIEASEYPLGAAKAQLHGTYIISQTKDSIIITDQHAAHERLTYEKIKHQIAKQGLIRQRLLIPEIIELTDEHRADLIIEHKDKLEHLGMSIEKFGDKSIIVTEVPSVIGQVDVTKLVHDIADHLHSCGENIALTELIEYVTETYACRSSVRAGDKMPVEAMNALLREMEATPFSGQCNHGRQTYIELKLRDIEKLFGRT